MLSIYTKKLSNCPLKYNLKSIAEKYLNIENFQYFYELKVKKKLFY